MQTHGKAPSGFSAWSVNPMWRVSNGGGMVLCNVVVRTNPEMAFQG